MYQIKMRKKKIKISILNLDRSLSKSSIKYILEVNIVKLV
nr:MAG TPA: hypothetical protein [Caudoviricetes sp.]